MTDYTYAVIDGEGFVTNIVASDNAEAAVPLRLLIPDAADIVLVTEETGPAYIGGDMIDGQFRMPQPYPSWVWDAGSWAAPVPYPEGGNGYTWDEESGSWIEIPAPVTEDDDV